MAASCTRIAIRIRTIASLNKWASFIPNTSPFIEAYHAPRSAAIPIIQETIVNTWNNFDSFINTYVKNKNLHNYFLVLTSQTLTSSSINSSTSIGFFETSFFFPQQARCCLRICLFASLSNPIVAFICVAIATQYASSWSIVSIFVSIHCAFLMLVRTFLCFISI